MNIQKLAPALLGLTILGSGVHAKAAVTPPPPVPTDTKQYAGHNCFSFQGPQTATNAGAVFNPSFTSFDNMMMDCPIVHDMFYGAVSGGTAHGGIASAFIRWQNNNPSDPSSPMQCTLKASRWNSAAGISEFILSSQSPQFSFSWANTSFAGADANYDEYNYFFTCRMPPQTQGNIHNSNTASYIMNYSVTEQGLNL